MAIQNDVKLFAGRNSMHLAKKIADYYGQPLAQVEIQTFSDGEFQPEIQESVRGSFVFIIQSTSPPAENMLELLSIIDAAKRASAHYITAVIPYFGYARQDRKDRPRVSIGSKLMANILTAAGANRVMTMDLHAGQIQGFFDIPVDHLNSSAIFMPYIESLQLPNLCFAAPDVGSTKRTRAYAQYFNADFVICDKYRKRPNEVTSMTVIGDPKGKNIIIIDDIVDTASTLCNAAGLLLASGALSVHAFCTHPVLSGEAYENIRKSSLSELVVCDTLQPDESKMSDKIKVLSVAQIFATAIRNTHEYKSINSLFINA